MYILVRQNICKSVLRLENVKMGVSNPGETLRFLIKLSNVIYWFKLQRGIMPISKQKELKVYPSTPPKYW